MQAYFLGQYPVTRGHPVHPEFPEGMSTERLFPEVSSEYKNPQTDISYTVGCYVPGVKAEATDEIACPFPFVRPIDENHPRTCILPW